MPQPVKKNAEALVFAGKEMRIEVNTDKTKYMVMSRDKNAGRSHSTELIIFPLKGWKNSNIWKGLITPKFYSGRN
jgi:hypothetical protein